jgi:hypothetical protein
VFCAFLCGNTSLRCNLSTSLIFAGIFCHGFQGWKRFIRAIRGQFVVSLRLCHSVAHCGLSPNQAPLSLCLQKPSERRASPPFLWYAPNRRLCSLKYRHTLQRLVKPSQTQSKLVKASQSIIVPGFSCIGVWPDQCRRRGPARDAIRFLLSAFCFLLFLDHGIRAKLHHPILPNPDRRSVTLGAKGRSTPHCPFGMSS